VRLSEIPEFADLTAKQKIAVTLYCGGASAVESISGAYNAKDVRTTARMAYEFFTLPSVLTVLISYFGPDDDRVRIWLDRFQSRISPAKLRRIKSQAQLACA
jgi:hypothetical protein